MHDDLEDLGVRLQDKGLKRTPIRLRLLQIFQTARRPLTSAQIWEQAQKIKGGRSGGKSVSMDRATLFRNLNTLVESELISVTEFGTGVSYYCINGKSQHHHHHVFCTSCETTSPLSICGVGPMIEQARKLGFQVMEHRLELLGLCSECR